MNRIQKMKKLVTRNYLLLSTIVFLGFMVYINIQADRLTRNLGATVLDFTLAYDTEKAFHILTIFGAEGRASYLNMIIKLDFLFPIAYAIFGFLLVGFSINKWIKKDSLLDLLLVMPLIGMLFDWLENLMIINMICNYPAIHPTVSMIASFSTIFKFIFTGFTLLTPLLLFFIRKKTNVIKNS